MSKPVIEFNTAVDLPFMRSPESEDADDGDGERDREAELEQMEGSLPDDAIALGSLEYEIDHSPGLSWRIEDHFYLVPLKGEPYEWALIRITWDDNWSAYQWCQDAVGSGFSNPRDAGRMMVTELFNRWDDCEEGDAVSEARKDFVAGL
jgi:hypothetical protein